MSPKQEKQPESKEETLSLNIREVVSKYAHDFNNLLVGIQGNARLLVEEGLVKTDGAPLIDQVLSCVERASMLTEEMFRKYGRRTSGEDQRVVPQPPVFRYSPAGTPERVAPAGEKLTVLIVDDESIVRSVSTAILERAGYRVLTAGTGDEGLNLYQSNRGEVLCVLLDLSMPYMSGNLVFARLKAIDPGVRVFLMSGYSDRVALEQFGSQGILGFIKKPFEPKKLVAAVRSVHESATETPRAAGANQ